MSARQATTLVATREIRERLRSRAFIISTALLLLVVGGSSALSTVVSTKKMYSLAVVAPAPPALEGALLRAAKPFDATVRVGVVRSAATGRSQLSAKKVDAVLVLRANEVVFRANVDGTLAAVVETAVREIRHHLPPTPELRTVTVSPPKPSSSDAETLVAMLGASLLLGSLAVYGQWVLSGVVEEKNNRVVELILSTVLPRHLLAGKVIGIGLLGLTQLALVAGLAATLLAAGVFDAPASLGGSVALVVPWFALGYALYAVAYAVAGALGSRQQDPNTAAAPVTYTLVAAFFAGYVTLTADADGIVAHMLTVFPLKAPFVLPARDALAGVPLWEHATAVGVVLLATYALVRFAGRVYSRGLIRVSSRLGIRAAWRLARQS